MNNNLIIVGADKLAVVAYEIAMDMKCFEKIAFAKDLFFDSQKWEERMREMTSPHTPTLINGKVYSFDDVM